jgi:sugar phosphate isomerase/epimerase
VFTGPLAQDTQVTSATASPEQWDAAARGLALLCAEAEKHGVRFCIEIHPGTLAENSHSALRLLEPVNSPSLVANPQIPLLDEDPWYSLGRLAGHIGHFHAHNWSDHLDGTLTPLARGIFDWESYLRKALEDGFDGYVSIEHANVSGGGDPWRAAEIDGPYLRDLAASLNPTS